MYAVIATKQYRKSLKKFSRSGSFPLQELEKVIDILASGKTLSSKHKDHKLSGIFKGYRECHVKSDILLVYTLRKKELVLVLVDLGSHAELFGM